MVQSAMTHKLSDIIMNLWYIARVDAVKNSP